MDQAVLPQSAMPSAMPASGSSCPMSYISRTEHQHDPGPKADAWTVGAPALIALAGVLLTLTVKWIEDRRAARRDLQRELFLKVTTSISESELLLGSFAKTTITIDKLGEWFSTCMMPLNQAEVVAKKPLLTAMTSLRSELGLAFGELIRARLPMERAISDIATNSVLIEDTSQEIKAVLAEQSRLTLDGIRTDEDRRRLERLQSRFNYFQKIRQEYYDHDEASREVIQKTVERVAMQKILSCDSPEHVPDIVCFGRLTISRTERPGTSGSK